MSAFGRSRSKRAERPSSAPHQDIEKTCNEIVDKRMVDVYKFMDSLGKKRKEFVRPPDIEAQQCYTGGIPNARGTPTARNTTARNNPNAESP